MAPKGKSVRGSSTSKAERKRGRPAGKNRAPLSLEERRSRNAKYEKERRVEMAAAMADLAEASGCNPQITNTELLAQVINTLQILQDKQSNQDIKRVNNNLIRQIDILTNRIKADPELCHKLDPDSDTDDSSSSSTTSDSESDTSDEEASSSESSSDEEKRPAKIIKTEDSSTTSEAEVPIQENNNNTSSSEENSEPFTELSFMTLFDGDVLEEAACSATNFFQSMDISEG